jgi:hypothetical protein
MESPMDPQSSDLIFVPRSQKQWLPMLIPTVICGASWLMGGIPMLTDVGFSFLTVLCLVFLISEFVRFPRRFGIGGILLYGGVLIWFAQDYFVHWFGKNFNDPMVGAPVTIIAKMAFFHCLFILMLILGLQIKRGQWLTRLVLSTPEPGNEIFYFILVVILQMIGFSAFFFTADSFFTSASAAVFGMWTGAAVNWTVGRTGNLNYNWGGYVAQIIQVGQIGGLLAVLFAIVISTKVWSKVLCWCIWAYWTLDVFAGGRRGDMAFMMFPPIALLFVKYQARAAMKFRRKSIWAYVIAGTLTFFLLVIVQIEGTYRAIGLQNADLSQVDLTVNQGNSMFSEGLTAWILIPDQQGFFANRGFGEGFIRPIPEQIYLLFVGAIPRALWNDKPVDGLWEWYNRVITKSNNGVNGTTIAHGLVGYWYFHYGVGGVLEGGLLVGWLMAICERALQESNGRPMGMFMSLGMAVWLFRCYRDFSYVELYALLIGAVVLNVLVRICRPMLGRASAMESPLAPVESPYSASYGV